jgi:hypothetical protein
VGTCRGRRCCYRCFARRNLAEVCTEMFPLHSTRTGDLGTLCCRRFVRTFIQFTRCGGALGESPSPTFGRCRQRRHLGVAYLLGSVVVELFFSPSYGCSLPGEIPRFGWPKRAMVIATSLSPWRQRLEGFARGVFACVSLIEGLPDVGAAAPRQGRNCSGIRYGRRCRFCPCGGAQWSATTFLCLTCCSLSFAVGLYSGPKPYTDPKILLF